MLLKTWGLSLRGLPFRRVQPPVAWEFDGNICESWGSVYSQYVSIKKRPQKWIWTQNFVCESNATKTECQLLQETGWAVCIVQIVRGWFREPWVSEVMFCTLVLCRLSQWLQWGSLPYNVGYIVISKGYSVFIQNWHAGCFLGMSRGFNKGESEMNERKWLWPTSEFVWKS